MNAENNSEVDLDVAIDGVLYAQDFKTWFGKSTFDSALAEIIQREHDGDPSFSLLDVLRLIEALYMEDVAMTFEKRSSARLNHADFYSYIHRIRANSEKEEWEGFFKKLLSRIIISCKRLRRSDSPRIHDTMPARPRGDLRSHSPPGSRPLTSGPSSASSSSSSRSGRSNDPLEVPGSFPRASDASHINQSPAARQDTDDMPRYTTVLQWHVDVEGGNLKYQYESLSLTPSVFRCTLNYGGLWTHGTGPSKQEAKHAASRQMCSRLNLSLDRNANRV